MNDKLCESKVEKINRLHLVAMSLFTLLYWYYNTVIPLIIKLFVWGQQLVSSAFEFWTLIYVH